MGCIGSQAWNSPSGYDRWQPYSIQTLCPKDPTVPVCGFGSVEKASGSLTLCDIPLVGFINSLQCSRAGDFLVAGVGLEHRLGQ